MKFQTVEQLNQELVKFDFEPIDWVVSGSEDEAVMVIDLDRYYPEGHDINGDDINSFLIDQYPGE